MLLFRTVAARHEPSYHATALTAVALLWYWDRRREGQVNRDDSASDDASPRERHDYGVVQHGRSNVSGR